MNPSNKNIKAQNKKRQTWLNRLSNVECPDTTYVSQTFPTVLRKGNGIHVTDINNKKFLDFTSGFGVLALGHRSKTTLHAIRKQSSKLIQGLGDVHPSESKIKLLELLAQVTPFENPKSMLGLSGGDAIEIAMKTSILATGRTKFISFEGGYHGLQLAPLNLNHSKIFVNEFKHFLQNKSLCLPFPYFQVNGPKCKNEITLEPSEVLSLLHDALKTRQYAALVLEPIQGRGGTRIFTQAFLNECKNLCQQFGTLLIFDEIMTGFGRTGKMFGYEHTQIVPDLICVGKSMGGGLPLSACIGDILDAWPASNGEAKHTQTFLGHPLACGVAYETILELKKRLPCLQNEAVSIEQEFVRFNTLLTKHKNKKIDCCFVRGVGFMHGLWFHSQEKNFAVKLMENLYANNILVLPEGANGNVLALLPPLIATQKHYQKVLSSILSSLDNLL